VRNSLDRRIRKLLGKEAPVLPALFGVSDGSFVTNGELLTPFGTPAGENSPAILCFHTLAESMSLCPLAIVRLKSTFWHCLLRATGEIAPSLTF
jgi:hypothetical protein